MKAFKTIFAVALAATWLPAAAARANEDLPVGVLHAKNVVERTVTIDDQKFRVTDRTEIRDLAGRPLRLEQLETAADQGPLVELDRVTFAYDAHGDALALLKAVPVPR